MMSSHKNISKAVFVSETLEDLREKGRLDRLYSEHVLAIAANKCVGESENRLLQEVKAYARCAALGQTHDIAAADEASQTTMIKVWRKLKCFDGRSKFSVWVFTIAQNALKDAIRFQTGHAEEQLDTDSLDWAETDQTDLDPPDHRISRLDDMIKGLSDKDQRVVAMYREECKPAEIGETFGKDAKWASNQLTRIKNLLKALAKSQKSNVLDNEEETKSSSRIFRAAD